MTKTQTLARIGFITVIITGIMVSTIPYLIPPLNGAPWGQPALASPYVRSTQSDRLVFTYYFYWYDYVSGSQMAGAGCTDLNSYHLTNLTGVSYRDPDWHYREFRDMISAGIDVFLPVYWGPTGWSLTGLVPMQIALDRLHAENYNNKNIRNATCPIPKVGLFFDTTSMMGAYNHRDTDGKLITDADLTNTTHCETFYHYIKVFFSQFNESDIYQIPDINNPEGPTAYIVWLFLASYFVHTSQSCLDYCKTQFLADFNHTLAFIGPKEWLLESPRIEGVYSWGSSLAGATYHNESPIRIAGIGPGYDNGNATTGAVCQVNQTQTNIIHDPERFTNNWTAALALDPNWVVIETWNEMLEGTGICRTEEHGDFYIQLNGNFSAIFHSTLPSRPFRWSNFQRDTIGIAIGCTAVIIIMTSFTNTLKKATKPKNHKSKQE